MCCRRCAESGVVVNTVRVGVVDIGTNSMRLLIRDGELGDVGRWVEVTGLGRGVDATGLLSDDAINRTLEAFHRFGDLMEKHGVTDRRAIATSATRDAANREVFLDRAESALGVRPSVIGGAEEGELAFLGATSDLGLDGYVVSDIGGGSTEFVTADSVVSVDIGSVRLSDRVLSDRPPSSQQLKEARDHVAELFAGVDLTGEVVGVAGTWTSLAAIDLALDVYDSDIVHHHRMERRGLEALVERLASMTVEQTAAIPSLDPKRAPVILAGAVVAVTVYEVVGVDHVTISERDSLDGVAMRMLGSA